MLANEIGIGRGFKGVVAYNMEGYRDRPNRDKCVWFAARNLATDDPSLAWRIMNATAALSTRVEKPVYHFSLDWHVDESPRLTKESALSAVDGVLSRLELAEHQAMVFWHEDAAHPHLHVVVNRVHPESGRAWAHWKSKERLERATAEVARDLGFDVVPGLHNGAEREDVAPEKAIDDEKRATRGEYRRAERQGDEPLRMWTNGEVEKMAGDLRGHFTESTSWAELSERLAEGGLELRTKGQGLIVTDGSGYAKLSSLGKDIRMKGLERTFGQSWRAYDTERQAGTTPLRDLVEADIQVRIFDRFDNRIRDAGEELAARNKSAKRAAWLHQRAGDTVAFHEKALNELLRHTYRDHAAALKKLDALAAAFDLHKAYRPEKERWKVWRDTLLGRDAAPLGKLKGINFLGLKTPARKNAERLHRRLITDRYRRLALARGKLMQRQLDAAIAAGRASQAKGDLDRAKATLGDEKQRHEARLHLHGERARLLRQVKEREIWTSQLPEDQKHELARQWEETVRRGASRQAEHDRFATGNKERADFTDMWDEDREAAQQARAEREKHFPNQPVHPLDQPDPLAEREANRRRKLRHGRSQRRFDKLERQDRVDSSNRDRDTRDQSRTEKSRVDRWAEADRRETEAASKARNKAGSEQPAHGRSGADLTREKTRDLLHDEGWQEW